MKKDKSACAKRLSVRSHSFQVEVHRRQRTVFVVFVRAPPTALGLRLFTTLKIQAISTFVTPYFSSRGLKLSTLLTYPRHTADDARAH